MSDDNACTETSADQERRLFGACSNTGRWGPDDERGTLNYITPQHVLAAMQTITAGELVSIGFELPLGDLPWQRSVMNLKVHHHGAESIDALDTFTVTIHGYGVTHMDAVGHNFYEGAAYNGRSVGSVISDEGLSFGSITAMANGVITRGVLLDVAAARGVSTLVKGEGITVDDVLAAERRSGTVVQEGDAIFIRSGIGQDQRWLDDSRVDGRPGLLGEVVAWIHERRVAVYSGDCIERVPDEGEPQVTPLHHIGLASMGLAILDNPNVEVLKAACERHGRSVFALFVAPLRIRGGTGSAVNPIAVY